MVKIEVIVRPYQTQIIRDILSFENESIIIEDVNGIGVNVNPLNLYKGQKKILESLPKSKITIYTYKGTHEEIIKLILEKIRTGIIGDGKIFVQEILNSIEII
ncbi:MAG TPA: P-II family nitrogen regulator [Spirochaetota bacterium]|nr:P-II family nitrogen regulator [Spirochaetota bacterium]HOM38344.1 P-II family nitrogen regulator [Spirochaetota bacterium]HPQ48438.1 P-II family nitrogen regulator [Spirochaetota bacterium]